VQSLSERQRLSPDHPYVRGDRVHHDSFGAGTVVNLDGPKLDIAFDRGGHKRVMDSFVTPLETD
jgi:DNA helicase-2/ATP-dependent DNA helicase PcrA